MKWPSESAREYESVMNAYMAKYYVDDLNDLARCRSAFEAIDSASDLSYAKSIARQALSLIFGDDDKLGLTKEVGGKP